MFSLFVWQVTELFKQKGIQITPIGSMGLVYLPTICIILCASLLCEYTNPMDHMSSLGSSTTKGL